jgi:hypothetical protein
VGTFGLVVTADFAQAVTKRVRRRGELLVAWRRSPARTRFERDLGINLRIYQIALTENSQMLVTL